jgi:hypothetical protein
VNGFSVKKENLAWQKALVFFVFLVLAFVSYRNCFRVDIPTDSYLLMFYFQKYGIAGMLHNFYDVGLYPVADLFNFLLYKLFNVDNPGWIYCSLVLHALNSFFLFLLGLRIFGCFKIKRYFLLSLFCSLAFLVSPYQTEVILWAPREYNYLLATGFFILSIYFLFEYCLSPSGKNFWGLHVSFILAILSFEQSLVFPLVGICLFVFFRMLSPVTCSIKKFLLFVFIPEILLVVIYFCVCKIWLGSWILHYGASIHLLFSLPLIVTNYVKYFAKFFFFFRYLPPGRSNFLHTILHIDIANSISTYLLFFTAAIIFCFLFYRMYTKQKNNTLLCAILFISFCISLLPVINLDTSFVGAVISDRYGYLPSVLFYLFLILFINLLFGKLWKIVSVLFVMLSFVLLSETTPLWTEADNYCRRLVKNFEPYLETSKKIYILNMPDNLNWILNFRDGFREYLILKYHKEVPDDIESISGFFMSNPNDSVLVTRISETEFVVKTADNKKRLLYGGVWGKSYETKEYSVEFNDDCSTYTLKFKEPLVNTALIYVAGDKWREIIP